MGVSRRFPFYPREHYQIVYLKVCLLENLLLWFVWLTWIYLLIFTPVCFVTTEYNFKNNDKEAIVYCFYKSFQRGLRSTNPLLVHVPLIIDLLLCSQMKNLPNYQKKKDGGKENSKFIKVVISTSNGI